MYLVRLPRFRRHLGDLVDSEAPRGSRKPSSPRSHDERCLIDWKGVTALQGNYIKKA